ncbi:15701_t:CDS:2 [Gigaspora margarita]|uniref:15701_t:CDS:1 n=1 Tax=Gigaspora margarita TaxID=4874 RepID=A0ABN7VJX3_GIGMA|nr:15701_t:CDS:2 [Gigaspora margarita]
MASDTSANSLLLTKQIQINLKMAEIGIIHAVFGMDDSENVRDGLLQKSAICAGWKLFHTSI